MSDKPLKIVKDLSSKNLGGIKEFGTNDIIDQNNLPYDNDLNLSRSLIRAMILDLTNQGFVWTQPVIIDELNKL